MFTKLKKAIYKKLDNFIKVLKSFCFLFYDVSYHKIKKYNRKGT